MRASLRQLSVKLNLQALSLQEGVRAALSVAVIVAANVYIQWPPLFVAALAALNTCMCDPGGPIRRRFPVLLTFTLLGALIMAGVGLARGGGIAVALPLGVFGIFCASFARIYGQTPQMVGLLLGVMLILALDRPIPDPAYGVEVAAAFVVGGLWAIVLTLVIWRVHPDRPALRALAEAYRALADTAEDLRSLLAKDELEEAAWAALAHAHRRPVRDAIETARTAVLELQRARGGASSFARQYVIRLEAADQVFGALIALSDTAERADRRQRTATQRLLHRLRAALSAFAQVIVGERTAESLPIDQLIIAMRTDIAELPPDSDAIRAIAEKIIELVRIAHTLSVPANYLPGAGLDGTPLALRQLLMQPLEPNLDWRSPALRHALRVAVTAAPAFAFTMLWFTPYDHWLTITIVMTMQPYFGLTYTRVLQRIGGTVAGGLAAALIGLVCTTPIAIAVAMFPLAMITLAARALSYSLFVALLTPLLVLLVDINQPGTSEWMVAGVRALFTVLGGVVAVTGCFLLWPNFEPQHLAQETRGAIAALGRYATAVLSHLSGEAPAATVEPARREAGIAFNSLETSISRTLLEPISAGRSPLQAATLIDAALRRCSGRLTAMMLDPGMPAALPQAAWRAWREWIARSSMTLASGSARLEARPQPSVESVARISRQFELIAGALERTGG